eukprot:1966799-Amphidinium_carterae.1
MFHFSMRDTVFVADMFVKDTLSFGPDEHCVTHTHKHLRKAVMQHAQRPYCSQCPQGSSCKTTRTPRQCSGRALVVSSRRECRAGQ